MFGIHYGDLTLVADAKIPMNAQGVQNVKE